MPLLEMPPQEGKLNPSVKNKMEKSMFSLKECQKKVIELAKSRRIVIFGEDHFNQKLNVFMADMLPELKKAGYSYMVLEEFTARQKYFDDYQDNKITFEDFRAKIGKDVELLDYEAFLLKKCKENGIRMVCADSLKGKDGRWSDKERFAYLQNAIPPDAKVLVDFGAKHAKYDAAKNQDEPSLGQLYKDAYGGGVLNMCIASFGGMWGNPDLDRLKLRKEGAFFTGPFAKTVLDGQPNPLKSSPEKTFFGDYDIIIYMNRDGPLSEQQLNEFFQKKE